MTETMVAQTAADSKPGYTVLLDCIQGEWLALCAPLQLDLRTREPAQLARRLRAAAAVVLRRKQLLTLDITDLVIARPVVDSLNVLPATTTPERCVFWCPTTYAFYRGLSVKCEQMVGSNGAALVWSWCPLCDTDMHVRGRDADYNGAQPQPHPAMMAGRNA